LCACSALPACGRPRRRDTHSGAVRPHGAARVPAPQPTLNRTRVTLARAAPDACRPSHPRFLALTPATHVHRRHSQNLKDGADVVAEVNNVCAWLMDPTACPTTWPTLIAICDQNLLYGSTDVQPVVARGSRGALKCWRCAPCGVRLEWCPRCTRGTPTLSRSERLKRRSSLVSRHTALSGRAA